MIRHVPATWLGPLLGFAPLFMMMGVEFPAGTGHLYRLSVSALGASILGIGAMLLVRTVREQGREIERLNTLLREHK